MRKFWQDLDSDLGRFYATFEIPGVHIAPTYPVTDMKAAESIKTNPSRFRAE